MTIIDAHAHLWQRSRTPQPWIDPDSMAAIDRDFWIDDLLAEQARTGVDEAILVQSSNNTRETVDLLALAGTAAVRGVVGWVDLEGDVDAQLGAFHTELLVGVRHLAHQDSDPEWLARPGLDFGTLAEHDLPFDFIVRPSQLHAAATIAAANPNTRFVLDHLGNPPLASGDLTEWRGGVARLAGLDNVYVKLSGITLQVDRSAWSIDDLREPVEIALDLFGPRRIMFGSDWPLVTIVSNGIAWIEIVRELIPAEHHDAVFRGTAERVYLGGPRA